MRHQTLIRFCLSGALIAGVTALARPVQAADAQPRTQEQPAMQMCPFCKSANNPNAAYGEKAGNTLMRGAMNLGFGWTEMILQPASEARDSGNVLIGLTNGVGRSVSRTLGGLGEVLTFWTPKVQDTYIHFSKDCPLDTPVTPPAQARR